MVSGYNGQIYAQPDKRHHFRPPVDRPREPAGADEFRDTRPQMRFLAERCFALRERRAANEVGQKAAGDDYYRYPVAEKPLPGEEYPVDAFHDAVAGDIQKRPEIRRYIQLAGDIAVQGIHVDNDDGQNRGRQPLIESQGEHPDGQEYQPDPYQRD